MLLWLGFALAAMATAPVQAQTATETLLHHFASLPQGVIPRRAWSATRRATFTGLLSTAAQGAGAYSSWIPPAARPCCTTSRAGPTGETLPAVGLATRQATSSALDRQRL